MILPSFLILGVFLAQSHGAEKAENIKPKQLFLSPENHYSSGVFDFNFLNSQQPSPSIPQYSFPQARQPIPRYQPQFVFYGGVPGQPFLVNPAPSPPNNFLFPPPGPQVPGVVYRNAPGGFQPEGPVFVGEGGVGRYPQGYPNLKPGFVPAIEKDAEEVPTNPARIPPFKPKKPVQKPEKLETLDTPSSTEADDLEGTEKPKTQPKIPKMNPVDAKPGHRFFVLNGQSLFNYPFSFYQPQNINPDDIQKYAQNFPKARPQDLPVPVIPAFPNLAFQNPQLPNFQDPSLQQPAVFDGLKPDQILNPYAGFPQFNPQQPGIPFNYLQPGVPSVEFNPLIAQQQQSQQPFTSPKQTDNPNNKQTLEEKPSVAARNQGNSQHQIRTNFFRNVLPLTIVPNEGENVRIRVATKDFQLQPLASRQNPEYFQQYTDGAENDAVVIDAKYEEENKENEGISVPANQPLEPSLAQAVPSAIALAGPGGVAAAGPRGTAFAGKEGMAVSSPRATAIAGPAKEDVNDNKDSKPQSSQEKREKYVRQRFRGKYQ